MRIAEKYGISPASLAIGTFTSYTVLFMFPYYIFREDGSLDNDYFDNRNK